MAGAIDVSELALRLHTTPRMWILERTLTASFGVQIPKADALAAHLPAPSPKPT
jgi:hypothetical protein